MTYNQQLDQLKLLCEQLIVAFDELPDDQVTTSLNQLINEAYPYIDELRSSLVILKEEDL